MNTLKVTRDSGYADRIREYKVICNSKMLGKLANGETKSFDIPEGINDIYLKIDWCRSNKITINKEGETHLYCGSNLKGVKALFTLFYVIFLPHKYLWLQNTSR